ncbi:hypothetical protein DAEQUDRAFT_668663, partial [Daedalea quercina L-15889]
TIMDNLASVFSGLPYFNPMMMLNKSETSATRRLLQCTSMGLYMNDISSKFAPPATEAPDLQPDDFAARRTVIGQVAHWCNVSQIQSKVEWVACLDARALQIRDWGHMLFTEPTISRFLVVMIMPEPCDCGNYSHHDYDMTKYQADRMMSLVTYLHDAWDWGTNRTDPSSHVRCRIRATYTTPMRGFKVDLAFLSGVDGPVTPSKGAPPIFHVTPDSFTPTLLATELEKIDNVCAQGRERQAGPDAMEAARKRVLGTKEGRPDVGDAWMNKNARECANCQVVKDKALLVCSRCKLINYCSKECQKKHWPKHKVWCKTAAAS